MAYKDILVYLDPTVETLERIRLAASLAKAHGARLIGVDVSAPAAGEEVETEAAVSRTYSDATRDSGLTTVFAPPQKPGELDNFTHCVDLMIAPGPESLARRGHSPRRARPGATRIRCADADAAAGMDARPGGRQHRHRLERWP